VSFETALRSRLKADASIGGAGARVDWDERPSGSGFPALVLQIITGMREQHYRGMQSLLRTRVQFDAMAIDYPGKKALREAVIATIASPADVDGIHFDAATDISFSTRNGEAGGQFVFVDQIDAVIWHRGI
tara:strand:+ start:738 stop:1130 length:393 start_codon:yes stop_codon:yes gene_type:complete